MNQQISKSAGVEACPNPDYKLKYRRDKFDPFYDDF